MSWQFPNVKNLPYISFVIVSRNDSYGGNERRRLQISVGGLLEQLDRYRLESELILVDWNPPPDRPPLKDLIDWPSTSVYCTVWCVMVHPIFHQRFRYHERYPFAGVGGWNVGIRRCRGQFIVPRAADVLYSNELVSFLAQKSLEANARYRVNRCDVSRSILDLNCNAIEAQLDFCRNHVEREYNFHPDLSGLFQLHTHAAGDFILMSKYYWHLLRGYWEREVIANHSDSLLCYASYIAGVKEIVLKPPCVIYKISHDQMYMNSLIDTKDRFFKRLILRMPLTYNLRNRLRMFYRKLPRRFFEHPRSKAWRSGVPTLSSEECNELIQDMITGKRSYLFNDEHWGLGDETLSEFIISRAQWDRE